jgi:hypothetical protein
MKITKYVELSGEVEVEVSAEDLRVAFDEEFTLPQGNCNRYQITSPLNRMAWWCNGLTDAHIALLTPGQRKFAAEFFARQAKRFESAARSAGSEPASIPPVPDAPNR